MADNLEKKFISELQEMINHEFLAESKQIQESFDVNKVEIAKELSAVLDQILNYYQILYDEGRVGQLSSIYISFLRSSMLDDYPAYRIDFYDEKDCLSMVECFGKWEFSYVFSHFYKIKEKIRKSFQSQNRVKAYEANPFLFRLYEQFHEIVQGLLPELFALAVSTGTGIDKMAMTEVRMGELFDDAVIIYTSTKSDEEISLSQSGEEMFFDYEDDTVGE